MTFCYVVIMLLTSVHAHSQIRDNSCNHANGVIVVANPAISSTYWIKDTTCVFQLDHYDKTVDAISVTRSQVPRTAGNITLAGSLPQQEDMSVHGEGEPFAILPMYNTKKFTDVLVKNVTVTVTGKAMVSFGMAEDPALIFGEVITDAYRAREWVYDAPYELLYIHVGLLLLVLGVAARGDWNWARWYCCAPCLRNQYVDMHDHNPRLANTISVLTDWLVCSLVTDHFIWIAWVWATIDQNGGALFMVVVFVRKLFYAYLGYILWETHVLKPGEWRIFNQATSIARKYNSRNSQLTRDKALDLISTANNTALRWVPLVIGGCLTGYVFAWLYMGRESFQSSKQVYYIGIPVLVGIFLWALPVTAAIKARGDKSWWYHVYVKSACFSHLVLVTLFGIVLNVGLGMLAPLCVLAAFWKRDELGTFNVNKYSLLTTEVPKQAVPKKAVPTQAGSKPPKLQQIQIQIQNTERTAIQVTKF